MNVHCSSTKDTISNKCLSNKDKFYSQLYTAKTLLNQTISYDVLANADDLLTHMTQRKKIAEAGRFELKLIKRRKKDCLLLLN